MFELFEIRSKRIHHAAIIGPESINLVSISDGRITTDSSSRKLNKTSLKIKIGQILEIFEGKSNPGLQIAASGE